VQGTWSKDDQASITIDGETATYKVTKADVTPPGSAGDAAIYPRAQIARGLEAAILAHPVLGKTILPLASAPSKKRRGETQPNELALGFHQPGPKGNGTSLSVSTSSGAGTLAASSSKLENGGYSDSAKQDIITTITHEFGHAFGYPHKCGYYTFEDPAKSSCCMNYFHSWLYKPGTHNDPSTRQVERFQTGESGKHFCARHTSGIRQGHLEDNPAIWTW